MGVKRGTGERRQARLFQEFTLLKILNGRLRLILARLATIPRAGCGDGSESKILSIKWRAEGEGSVLIEGGGKREGSRCAARVYGRGESARSTVTA
jgi:hypothetical protein